jgi:hypothetical protein
VSNRHFLIAIVEYVRQKLLSAKIKVALRLWAKIAGPKENSRSAPDSF